MKLTPPSIAACSARIDVSSSTAPHDPPIAHAPKLTVETRNPVRPSSRYCIRTLPTDDDRCDKMPAMNRTLALGLALAAACATLGAQQSGLTSDSIKGLPLRSIGPDITTGRVSDIDIDPKNPNVWYVASASGGLFKTEDRGNHFPPIFDEGGAFSLGAVVVDPKNSSIVWLGTGENNNQRSVSYGDGVYKSTDAGKTWKRMGLENSEHIQNIAIDPRNSNVV